MAAERVITSPLTEVTVKPIPNTGLVELGINGRKAQIVVELTANQAEGLAELLVPAAAEARRDGP